ncbi:uncharacterized protein LOC133850276 [Drosophila sulfurigaster albostrigata]|uniref:uncharacterized protein LOC133850276 n=1 Tax=Drosophila sulfurigaster albostrigata TaxID=89887 RepID=UPI002D21E55E|nr:uncharacterized protein LOC133850276 [Drosophila sulfurigaster albostrigata]
MQRLPGFKLHSQTDSSSIKAMKLLNCSFSVVFKSKMGKSCETMLLALLLLASYAIIYMHFWKPRCIKPFVEIGSSCYFFSTNKAPTYEYYKVSYKGRIYSVPAMLDWLHAGFACEAIDSNARLVSIESAEVMRNLANFMLHSAHANTHPHFWSGGHRGNLAAKVFDHLSMKNFYWHNELHPMNYTNFLQHDPDGGSKRYPNGYCVYLDFLKSDLVMRSANCKHQMAFVCELPWQR